MCIIIICFVYLKSNVVPKEIESQNFRIRKNKDDLFSLVCSSKLTITSKFNLDALNDY